MNKYKLLKTGIIASLAIVLMMGVAVKSADALIFTPKLQLFTFNIQKLKLKSIFSLTFNKSLAFKQFLTNPIASGDCEHEYDRCVGRIDQFDDSMEFLLLQAKNACISSGEGPQETCFGLDIEVPEEDMTTQTYTLNPPSYQCTGPETKSCTTANGQQGIQRARSCNTTNGEWVYGLCIAEIIETPPPSQCEGSPPPCPSGYTGSYFCSNGTWVNGCKAPPPPSCQGAPPLCPEGYSGSYVCQNGNWVNQCQAPPPPGSNCPELDPDYKVCIMSDGRYGREYTDYCNESTGEWVFRPCNVYINLQPTCTSFTYTDWSTCSSGNQSRTILTRAPYGCAGGSPVTYQTCCVGEEPACPSGWSGSYTCSNNYWFNTCVPPGAELCYRGVKYKNVVEKGGAKTYAQCAGSGHYVNGKFCLDNVCSSLQAWNNYGLESGFKSYVDTLYDKTIPASCNPSFKYTQCK
jgi:hypothetical protein